MNGRLTLDLGMRFTHHGPQYDVSSRRRTSSPTSGPRARRRSSTCPDARADPGAGCPRVAVDPAHRRVARRRLVGRDRHDRAEHGHAAERHHPGRQRHREGKLHRAVAGLRPARWRRLRRDGHAADRRSRQRRRLLRSPAGRFDLRPDRQPADRPGLDRRQLDAAAGRAGHGRRAAAARHAHL